MPAANVHDSQEMKSLTKKGDGILYEDSAYIGARIEEVLKKKEIEGRICERAYRNTPLSQEEKYEQAGILHYKALNTLSRQSSRLSHNRCL